MHLDDKQKEHIISLIKRNYKYDLICDIYEIQISTLYRFLQKIKAAYFNKNQISQNEQKHINILNILHDNNFNAIKEINDKKDQTNNHDKTDELLIQIISENCHITLKQISAILQQNNIILEKSAIHVRLHKLDIIRKNIILKPLLSNKHINDRQYWAYFYSNYNWDSVIWSDETVIVNDSYYNNKIWVHKDRDIVQRTVKHPLKIHIWGCIQKNKKLLIHICEENMKSMCYVNILTTHILPIFKNTLNLIFQQDNATPHTAYGTQIFF